jgi:hypothetical protein
MRHNWATLGLAIEVERSQAYVTFNRPLSRNRVLSGRQAESFSPGELPKTCEIPSIYT